MDKYYLIRMKDRHFYVAAYERYISHVKGDWHYSGSLKDAFRFDSIQDVEQCIKELELLDRGLLEDFEVIQMNYELAPLDDLLEIDDNSIIMQMMPPDTAHRKAKIKQQLESIN